MSSSTTVFLCSASTMACVLRVFCASLHDVVFFCLQLNNSFTFVRGKSKATNTPWLLLSKRVTKNALLTAVPTICVRSLRG
jgi:hypothetical protein